MGAFRSELLSGRRDRYASVDGLKIRYWDEGEGQPVVLLHGLAVSAESWLLNVEALASRHRVVVPDLPGAGYSSRLEASVSSDYATKFMASFLGYLGIQAASVVGNSLGGYVGLKFALDCPGAVEKLVLVDSAGLGREISALFRVGALLSGIPVTPPRPVIAVAAKQAARYLLSNADSLPPELLSRWVEMLRLPGSFLSLHLVARNGLDLRGQRDEVILARRLASLRIPLLVVWGDKDPVFPVAQAENARRLKPDAELQVLPGYRHCPPLECPELFNQLVLDFLDRGSETFA